MNAFIVEVSGPYSDHKPLFPYRVINGNLELDCFRSRKAAEHAAKMLNANRASVNPHGLIGCRVEIRND